MKQKIFFLILWFSIVSGRGFVLAQTQNADNLTDILTTLGGVSGGQGIPGGSYFSVANIIGALLFGGIGFAVFIYGKKERRFKPLLIGIALMAYPYFLKSTMGLYIVGLGLCALLYLWRD